MAQHRRRVTDPRHEPVANPALAEGMRMLARSGAAGAHDSRPRRERTRAAAKRAAIRQERD